MTCFRCKGDTEHKLIKHAATLVECVIIVKNVPALVCEQCGEIYFADGTMRRLENIVDRLESIIKMKRNHLDYTSYKLK